VGWFGFGIVGGTMKKLTGWLPVMVGLSVVSVALVGQPGTGGSLGIFRETADIGTTRAGTVTYSAANGSYRVTGGGGDLWGKEDDFRFVWLPVTGDAAIEADVTFPAEDVVPKEKAMLIFRQTVRPDAAYADLAIHGDGHIALQFRKVEGGETADLTAAQHGSRHLRLERRGDHFTASVGPNAAEMTTVLSTDVALHGPVLVGLGVCAHEVDGLHTAVFSKVKLTASEKSSERP
jgi:TolB protein